MRADQMTFGIEIECFIPNEVVRRLSIRQGGYGSRNGVQCPELPEGWNVTYDCSISTRRRNFTAFEIVSPVLKGREGMEAVVQVVNKLNEWGVTTNQTTGFHVHVGTDGDLKTNAKVVRNLIHLTGKFERALFAVTGTKNREHGRWAAPMRDVYRQYQNMRSIDDLGAINRYHSLNLTNLTRFGHGHGTVEFRVFQGTTNLTKILGYIQICLGLVENAYAITRKPSYSCKNVRHQTGRGLWYRMARNFNWYSEKRMGDKQYGMLTPERLPAIKKEMERLANKYDADQSRQHDSLRPVV